jgi:hypothetical protein
MCSRLLVVGGPASSTRINADGSGSEHSNLPRRRSSTPLGFYLSLSSSQAPPPPPQQQQQQQRAAALCAFVLP